jgi:hypothetical protein
MRKWLSTWERPMTIEAEEFIEAGNRILVLVRWAGRGKGSGAQIEARGAHLNPHDVPKHAGPRNACPLIRGRGFDGFAVRSRPQAAARSKTRVALSRALA